jgi:hypothetical protein
MSKAIALAEAEGAIEEFEEMGNLMHTEDAGGAEFDNSLQRGLREKITGRPRPSDPDYQETRSANILREKQPMTLSQQAEDGRPRLRQNEGIKRTETNGARGAAAPAAPRSMRMRPKTSPSASVEKSSNPRTINPGHAATMADESERAETPWGLWSAAHARKSEGTICQTTLTSICDKSRKVWMRRQLKNIRYDHFERK